MQEIAESILLSQIEDLKAQLAEAHQLIQAIKDGEVDAFAVGSDKTPQIFTLQSGDYAYRVLVEEFGEGALNVTEDGLIVYTNRYFFEFTALSYEQVIGSNIINYIAPDSTELFRSLFTRALTGRSKGEINLTVNDTVIPVYISMTSLQPNLPTVGIIISDLTQKKNNEAIILQYQASLEEKNLALTRSNEELASFAYVASHDLQEPLRKINLFSTRILEHAQKDFTPQMFDYFQRIIGSAKRMQDLIRALLDYSRLNTSAIGFLDTDLNLVLEEVKFSIKEVIEDNRATITTSILPVTSVIPYQINQLFTNLILNAIKYKKATEDPLITISTTLVDSGQVPANAPVRYQKYWQIQVADNGIGFEAAYAEKIFEVLQRLHSSAEYEGTGIGLAICRKIMKTHDGFITADGKPGVGAVFTIYLPFNP